MKDPKWDKILEPILNSEAMKELKSKVKAERLSKNILPIASETFDAFNYSEYKNLKIVIIGPEPYSDVSMTNGLAFSSRANKPSEQLSVIFKSIHRSVYNGYSYEQCFNGYNLIPWAQQGILLLNAVMTVEAGKPKSHRTLGWDAFTIPLIKELDKFPTSLVFILMSNVVHSYKEYITNPNHLVITTPYPNLKNEEEFLKLNIFDIACDHLINTRKDEYRGSVQTEGIQLLSPEIFDLVYEKIVMEYKTNNYLSITGHMNEKINIFDRPSVFNFLNKQFWYPYYNFINFTI